MTRALIAALLLIAAAPPVAAQCQIDNSGEYANPTAPGCGDVILHYTESSNGTNEIPLGYPVPIPVDSLTPVAGFRTYASLLAAQQDFAATVVPTACAATSACVAAKSC